MPRPVLGVSQHVDRGEPSRGRIRRRLAVALAAAPAPVEELAWRARARRLGRRSRRESALRSTTRFASFSRCRRVDEHRMALLGSTVGG